MAGGLGDLFNDQRNAPAMLAPGTPAAALSGSPAATLTNLAAISGANAGASLGGALGGLVGLPTANPAAMLEARQAEFAKLFDEVQADGTMMYGDAMRKAGKLAYQKGILTPPEYMKLQEAANTQGEKDRKHLDEHLSFVRDSDAYKDYVKTDGVWQELKETVKRGKAGKQSANDYFLIQQGLKILDPGSIVSDNEIQSGQFAARGSRALKLAGINLTQLASFAATGGKGLELTAQQKDKWLKAIAGAVDAQKNALSTNYLTARQGYQATGGSAQIFEQATAQIGDLMAKAGL